jgi:phage terminase large subunit GpA-like protein
MVASQQPAPPPAELWDESERQAWAPVEAIKPSQWAERYRRLLRSSRKGPYRNDNAPYLRGMMDISTAPGVTQANWTKPGQIGASEAGRNVLGWKAHTSSDPAGLTLPNRDKGRKITKSDVLPLFKDTPVLANLIGQAGREALIESIKLLNGFTLDLMWSGSPASMASTPMAFVFNDEVNKFERWTGTEPDPIRATEIRLTSYGDRRLQLNASTPTVSEGTITVLVANSSVKLLYFVPCPHCGRYQVLKWGGEDSPGGIKWLDGDLTVECLEAAEKALAEGQLNYAAGGGEMKFARREDLVDEIEWLSHYLRNFNRVRTRAELAAVLQIERERAIYYQCEACRQRIYYHQQAAMVRQGRWTTVEGFVTDYWGNRHVDAEQVTRWPHETSVGFSISAVYCLWIHWGLLVSEWLTAQHNPRLLFAFVTNRLGEAYEQRAKRLPDKIFADKCQTSRGAIAAGLVPRWAWVLLATIDTQQDCFYAVVRAWGGSEKSARVWHGKLLDFSAIDKLLFDTPFPVEGGLFPPMRIARALIDSGGTADRVMDASRTQQVYHYVIPRQPYGLTAIKGASRPGPGLYFPMKNPASEGGKVDVTDLRALMVDTHRCNDLLSEKILQGVPVAKGRGAGAAGPELWLLNVENDPEYNQHMAAVGKTLDPATMLEVWKAGSGKRHDYRDCEAYQIALADLANVHLLPPEAEVLQMKQELLAPPAAPPESERTGSNPWSVTPFTK